MTNSEKIQILKENLKSYINNLTNTDEGCVFNFAKAQAKEMKIEISKGEIRSIITELMILNKQTDSEEHCLNKTFNPQFQTQINIEKEASNENYFIFQ